MEELEQDINTIKSILGIDNTESIREFLQRVPSNNNLIRIQVTLWHFISSMPSNADAFELDSNFIQNIFQDVSKESIIDRLKVYGSMANRREIVIHQLLHEKRNELDNVLNESNNRKRPIVEIKDDNEKEEPALKIKIKKNGENELVCLPVEMKKSDSQSNSQKTIILDDTERLMDTNINIKDEEMPSTSTAPNNEHITEDVVYLNNEVDDYSEVDFVDPLPSTSKGASSLIRLKHGVEELQEKIQKNHSEVTNGFLVKKTETDNFKKKNLKPGRIWVKEFGKEPFNNIADDFVDLTSPTSSEVEQDSETNTATETKIFDNILNLVSNSTLPHNNVVTTTQSNKNNVKNQQNNNEIDTNHPTSSKVPLDLDFEFDAALETLVGHIETPIEIVEINEKTLFEDEEPVAGPSTSKQPLQCDEKIVLRLIEMFPDACPRFLREIALGKTWNDMSDAVTEICLQPDYPRRAKREKSPEREVDPEEQYEILKELFPDADPTYLHMQANNLAHQPAQLKEFINYALEHRNYPTMKEYLRKQQLSAQQKQYTQDFNVENFVQIFPDPKTTFNDTKRIVKMDNESMNYLQSYLRNKFSRIHIKTISSVIKGNNGHVGNCLKHLENIPEKFCMKTRRKNITLPNVIQNIPMLQEIAYYEHKQEIENYLEQKRLEREHLKREAKENGTLQTCNCCFDEEVMPTDVLTCELGCKFCRDCIKKSIEVAMGDAKIDFKCLNDCNSEFNLQTIQNVVSPKLFSIIAQKKAVAELKTAGIDDLEMCPFCDFANIPAETDKVFRCLNPDCMKESCRLCKEPSHVPLKCDEVEKDNEVKARTYVENKMTEALLRKCWKCGMKFIKIDGCNKMTCSCGASMCYICGQAVTDYNHFNRQGFRMDLCPMYSDVNALHKQNVLKGAEEAKAELGVDSLKYDPTKDVNKHYKEMKKKSQQNRIPPDNNYQHLAQILQRVAAARGGLNVNVNRGRNPWFFQ